MVRRTMWLVLAAVSLISMRPAAGEEILDKRLLKKTDLTNGDRPVVALLKDLAASTKTTIEIDPEFASLANSDGPAFLGSAEGITLQSALNLLTRCSGVGGFVMDQSTVRVLDWEQLDEQLTEADHSLVGLGPLTQDLPVLIDVIQNGTSLLWDDIDGSGGSVVDINARAVRIKQTRGGHLAVADLLQQISSVVQGRGARTSVIDKANERVTKSLARAVVPTGGATPLNEALETLLGKNGIPWILVSTDLSDEGIDPKSSVTVAGERRPIGEHVNAILAGLSLTAIVEHEVVVITTQQYADTDQVTVVYDVRRHLSAMANAEDVLEQLMEAEGTGMWEDKDGDGGRGSSLGPLLVVVHNRQSHARIAELLKTP